MGQKIIIAIDGFSSCGKSTLAQQLAKCLLYLYIDSGSMYRAITLYFLRNLVQINKKEEVSKALEHIHLSFINNKISGNSDMYLNNKNVEALLRQMIISDKVSEIAALKEVRKLAVSLQQNIGKNKGIVMDGRDIGTTVFPDAELKIFMIADIAVRTERRFKELYATNPNITVDEIKHNLKMRDYIDSNRKISPLKKASDAIVLDTTNLSMAQQLKMALQWTNEKLTEVNNIADK